MLTDYINAAMHHAYYEYLEEDKVFYGEIPPCQGVMATGVTLEACREELESALESWLISGLQFNDPIPEIDGIYIKANTLING